MSAPGPEGLADEIRALRDRMRSVLLATVDAQGRPHASYAPCLNDENDRIYLYVSALAVHTRNLEHNPTASVLFIEDEATAANIFARRRLELDCRVQEIVRETPAWSRILDRMATRHGRIVATLRGLADFRLLALTPQGGSYVRGFGQAYRLQGPHLEQITPRGGGGRPRPPASG